MHLLCWSTACPLENDLTEVLPNSLKHFENEYAFSIPPWLGGRYMV